jgi:toxin ParE1/3/4
VAALIRTARAEEDLIEIWSYIARDDPMAADRVLDRIDGVCLRLAENPYLGPARPDLARELRYFVTGSYLVLYRNIGNGVEIVRVIHGARDLPSLFRDA